MSEDMVCMRKIGKLLHQRFVLGAGDATEGLPA
jgi:hypothetical protein